MIVYVLVAIVTQTTATGSTGGFDAGVYKTEKQCLLAQEKNTASLKKRYTAVHTQCLKKVVLE